MILLMEKYSASLAMGRTMDLMGKYEINHNHDDDYVNNPDDDNDDDDCGWHLKIMKLC